MNDMKMKYVCEQCGKHYNSAGEAMDCEKIHKAEAEDKLNAERSEKKITEAVSCFIKKYKRLPKIFLDDDIKLMFDKDFKFSDNEVENSIGRSLFEIFKSVLLDEEE